MEMVQILDSAVPERSAIWHSCAKLRQMIG